MSAGFGIQDALAALVALGATGWLFRRWFKRRKQGVCTCDGCPAAKVGAAGVATPEPAADTGLVRIDGIGG